MISNLKLFYMVHCDANHLADAVVVEDFDSVDLETGKCPGITAPEEDVDGGGNI